MVHNPILGVIHFVERDRIHRYQAIYPRWMTMRRSHWMPPYRPHRMHKWRRVMWEERGD